jgi:excinuclease ABC subunit C
MEKRSDKKTNLLETARTLASSPGVYLMKSGEGQIVYVGKAKSLRSRVTSYFQPVVHEHPRTELMLSEVSNFEVIHTETENEALVLECTLIKRYKPKFNIRLKDDKHYPYLSISLKEDFARIEWTRKVNQEHARYFGPFPSSFAARIVMRLLTEAFQLRDCNDNTFSHRSRACILHQMGKCSAPCVNTVTREEYAKQLEGAMRVLEGKSKGFLSDLKKEMKRAAEEERYEDAARLRDQIQAVEVVSQTQSVVDADQRLDQDVFAFAEKEGVAHGVVLQVRGGKLLSVKHYDVQNFDGTLGRDQILYDFLAQHVLLMDEGNELVHAKSFLMRETPQEQEFLESALGVRIEKPATAVQKQLVSVAETNARFAVENAKRENAGHGVAALEEIQEKLGLHQLPRRIECYDISNTQGEESVASRVVFVDGTPEKTLYRRYKIKTVQGANDFASMREIFDRRFSKMDLGQGNEKPDLVVVDGGKGQLAQAKAIFEELGIQGVDLVGLAKARTERNFQSKEVESSLERIFIPNRVNPVPLYPHTRAYKLLTHIRDEAHRFAITFHRSLRDKRSLGKKTS